MDRTTSSCETYGTHQGAVDAWLAVQQVEVVLHPCGLWQAGGCGRQGSGWNCQQSACGF